MDLNSLPDALPQWNDDLKIFPEAADTVVQRRKADRLLNQLLCLRDDQGLLIHTSEELEEHYQNYIHEQKELDPNGSSFTLTNLLGAIKRRTEWFRELKRLHEDFVYDKDVSHLTTLERLATQAIQLSTSDQEETHDPPQREPARRGEATSEGRSAAP
jgi:hypothetical protein